MGKRLYPVFLLVLFLVDFSLNAQTTYRFTTIDSLLQFAGTNSSAMKAGNEQALLAKWTRLASMGNTINLKSQLLGSWTDNTQLPLNYIPAEAFGGVPGTVKELQFGQKYVSAYGFTPQLDIINPAAWARIRSGTLNLKLTETTNLLTKKNLFESIAAAYFNIASIQKQITEMSKNKTAADSIFFLVRNKVASGISREQEKNNAEINALNVSDKLFQLTASLEQQYNSLKILCDIQQTATVFIEDNSAPNSTDATQSKLLERQQNLQAAYLKSELRYNRLLSFAPTVSLIFNQAWQKNSNVGFFDSEAHRFSSQYIGLKLSVPLPIDVNRLSQNYTSKINYSLSKINSEHAALQNNMSDEQLNLEYQKALSSFTTAKKIKELKEDSYQKSLNQYQEGIVNTENLLVSFSDKVNAEINAIAAESALLFTSTKIKINNRVQ